MRQQFILGALLGSCSALAGTVPGYAQVATGEKDSTSPLAQAAEPAGADIVITAQRRSERLQDVPIAVSALSGDALKSMGVNKPQDIFRQMPSITFQAPAGAAGFPIFVVRGVAMLDLSYTSESSVATYRDDVYQGNNALAATPVFDLERVEVLRGPQGTLWGRNATGGLINFISAKPTQEFAAGATVQYGNYDDVVLEGYVSGPLSDTVRARLAGRFNSNNGYQTDVVNGLRLGTTDHAVDLRGILAFDPTDALSITLSAHFTDASGRNDGGAFKGTRQPGNPAASCALDQVLANQCVNSLGYRNPTFTRSLAYSGEDLSFSRHGWGASGHIELDLGGVTLTSITAYETIRKFEGFDADRAPIGQSAGRFLQVFDIDHEQISQEIRLSGKSDKLKWQVGGFYYHDKRFYTSSLPFIPAGNWADQSITSYSVFAQGTYALTDTFNLTAGARYTKDKKDILLAGVSAGSVPGTRLGTRTFLLDSGTAPDAITWRLGADYHVAQDVMFFATASTGYKVGGFNATGQFSAATAGPVAPEKITAYELGVKSSWLDRRLTANLTIYHTIWDKIQAAATVPIPGTNTIGVVYTNIGKAKIDGLEAEIAFRPIDELSFNAGLSLNHNKVRAPGVIIGGRPIDGNVLANTPKTSIFGGFNWEPRLANDSRLIFGANASYQSRKNFRPDNSPFTYQPAYTLVDARAGWADASDRYRVEVFAKNLFDKKYFESGAPFGDEAIYAWGMPRTYGVRVTSKF
ncbi:TonB-dependent receptor [Sphingobium sp. JS3065]|uniref:TonB-dependent receptor n=1 Tax=Sphingobium sp. JS3065 TaxID=2970925 RepID=UPI00226426E4|nr:TonB-dependent receptor [Sphingobium sp. JS3065]UZW56443.1 TonB-dependent receptor [Sphingobium sp. JS3065]